MIARIFYHRRNTALHSRTGIVTGLQFTEHRPAFYTDASHGEGGTNTNYSVVIRAYFSQLGETNIFSTTVQPSDIRRGI